MNFRNGLLAVMLNHCAGLVRKTDKFISAQSMKLRTEQALRRAVTLSANKGEDDRD